MFSKIKEYSYGIYKKIKKLNYKECFEELCIYTLSLGIASLFFLINPILGIVQICGVIFFYILLIAYFLLVLVLIDLQQVILL